MSLTNSTLIQCYRYLQVIIFLATMKPNGDPMLGIIPNKPIVTTKYTENGILTEVCIDAQTERTMQNQRLVAMSLSPLLVYSGVKLKDPTWLRVTLVGMGFACFFSHLKAYTIIRPYLKGDKK